MSVPGAIALESLAVSVMAEAIDFHDHAHVSPEEVNLVRANARIDFWLGKTVAATEA